MSDNKALWNRVCVTDPKHVKAITGKQYKGNSPKPYWIIERLTEEFGPCGLGWGFDIVNERMERMSETDVLSIATVRFWYTLDGKTGTVTQVGQTKASYKTSSGSLLVDEDAPKKSVTDALVKCASYIGFAGDIFAGRWDDSKYVAAANKEWRDREKAATKPEEAKPAEPTERQAELEELALYLIDCHENGHDMEAINVWYADDTFTGDDPNEERKFVWGLLKSNSKLRSTIKANNPHQQKEAA